MEMNDRIKEVRKFLGFNQEDFAAKIGLTKNYISLVETGNRTLSEQSVKLLCREFNINEEWLRTGTGEMMVQKTRSQLITDFLSDLLVSESDDFKKRFIEALAQLDVEEWKTIESVVKKLTSK